MLPCLASCQAVQQDKDSVMAFADPQSITIATVAHSLPRVSVIANGSTYQEADGSHQLVAGSQYGKRTRRTVRLNVNKIAADPFTSGLNVSYNMSCYLVVDVPIVGFSQTEQFDNVVGLTSYLDASSGAIISELLGGQN